MLSAAADGRTRSRSSSTRFKTAPARLALALARRASPTLPFVRSPRGVSRPPARLRARWRPPRDRRGAPRVAPEAARALQALTRLGDRDSMRVAVKELTRLIATMPPEHIPVILQCLCDESAAAPKAVARRVRCARATPRPPRPVPSPPSPHPPRPFRCERSPLLADARRPPRARARGPGEPPVPPPDHRPPLPRPPSSSLAPSSPITRRSSASSRFSSTPRASSRSRISLARWRRSRAGSRTRTRSSATRASTRWAPSRSTPRACAPTSTASS